MSPSDYKYQRLNKNEARKLIARLIGDERVRFSNHAYERMDEREISIQDAINVLESPSSFILGEGELENGSYRYQLCTNRFKLVVGFASDGSEIVVLSVMRRTA
jgi:hypothetical protein